MKKLNTFSHYIYFLNIIVFLYSSYSVLRLFNSANPSTDKDVSLSLSCISILMKKRKERILSMMSKHHDDTCWRREHVTSWLLHHGFSFHTCYKPTDFVWWSFWSSFRPPYMWNRQLVTDRYRIIITSRLDDTSWIRRETQLSPDE